MKILVVSDSHGDTAFLEKALACTRSANILVHLGDGADDLDLLREYTGRMLVYQCCGNMDFHNPRFSERCIFPAGGVTVFAAHGHMYGVKSGLTHLYCAAKEKNAALCLFGHTHTQHAETWNGMCVLNPGSIRRGDYAVVTIENSEIKYELKQI